MFLLEVRFIFQAFQMNLRCFFTLIGGISLCPLLWAQPTPILKKKMGAGEFSINAYGDFGYVVGPQKTHTYFDFITKDTVTDFGRRDFTSYPLYANSFGMAYGYVQAQFEIPQKFRMRIALHAGHIVEALYTEEMQSLKMIREASISYHFSPRWSAEIGIFPSYYGAEIVLNKENLHATRAYIADFTPDYEAGIRVHYKATDRLTLRALLLNGWQEIKDLNGRKAFGLGLSYLNENKFSVDWHTYVGNEAPLGNNIPAMYRFYSNLYAKFWLGPKWIFFPVLDFVVQQKPMNADGLDMVIAPAMSLRYAISEKLGVAMRYEYLLNRSDIVPELRTGTPNGWESHSGTATFEYLPIPEVTFRLEGRYGLNKDAVFRNALNQPVKEDYYGIASIAFHF